ncbi:MAG: TolC family protein [Gemmatimonadaceae bacterium]
MSRTLFAVCALVFAPTWSTAQTSTSSTRTQADPTRIAVSRDDAIRMALERSPRGAIARADSAAAIANVLLARQYENPTLSASYSKSEPQVHFSLDIPFDWPSLRQSRVAAASSGVAANSLRTAYGRAVLALDVDTAYTRAQALSARSMLTTRSAVGGDSLLTIARLRRDAGDASDLDVELARVFAGQSANAASNDSLSALSARMVLQSLIGLSADSAHIVLSETMALSDSGAAFTSNASSSTAMNTVSGGPTFNSLSTIVAAAERDAEAASYRVLVEQRRRIALPSLSVGFETVNSSPSGILPTIGLALPFPLFNRNFASIQVAQAELARARANVAFVRLDQANALASAQRDATAARARLARSAGLVASANRVSALSLIAYREGATPLTSALDAQRSAREVLSQYVDDIATARIAESVLRLFSLTTVVPAK